MSAITGRLRGAGRRIAGPPPTSDGAPLFWTLALVVAVMTLIGLLMVLSASSVIAIAQHESPWSTFEKQLLWALLGAVAFWVMARVDYHAWARRMPWLLLFAFVSLVAVLVPHVGQEAGGARRWIILVGGYGYQPSEVAKLFMLLFGANVLAQRAQRVEDWKRALAPVLSVCVPMCALVMLEPDLDAALEIAMIAGVVLFIAGVPWKQIFALGVTGVFGTLVLALAAPYRRGRVLTFLHPDRDPLNRSFQTHQSLIAIGSGGFNGVGLGAGHAKWQFLPAAHTDFIFAIIAEELGLLGCLAVLALFGLWAFVGCRIALRAPDRFGMLIAAGVTAWVCGQAIYNISMVVGLIPVSGTPLPFISAGGSSLVVLMAAAGLLGNVARQCTLAHAPHVNVRTRVVRPSWWRRLVAVLRPAAL